MTFDCEDETNCLLAAADDIRIIVKIQPQPLPEALGAYESPTSKAVRGTEGTAPPEGNGGERAFARGPLLIFRRWRVNKLSKSRCFSRTLQTIRPILNSTCV